MTSENVLFSMTAFAMTILTTLVKNYFHLSAKLTGTNFLVFWLFFIGQNFFTTSIMEDSQGQVQKMHPKLKIPMCPHDSESITSWYDCIRIDNIYHPR
jgi:hypothetical protein